MSNLYKKYIKKLKQLSWKTINPEIVSLLDIACACMQMELYYITCTCITLSTHFFYSVIRNWFATYTVTFIIATVWFYKQLHIKQIILWQTFIYL